jgi:hypothetical protein
MKTYFEIKTFENTTQHDGDNQYDLKVNYFISTASFITVASRDVEQ